MLRVLSFAILFGFVLELASLIWVGSRIGLLLTLLLLAAGMVIGMTVIRHSGMDLAAAMRRAELRGQFTTSDAGQALLWTAAGMLFIVPGFASDVVATVLIMPPVTRWLANRLASGVRADFTAARSHRGPGGVVIEGDAVEISGEVVGPGESRD